MLSKLTRGFAAYQRFHARDARWKEIVFYAETRNDWHHLRPLVLELIGSAERDVAYLTSDGDDYAFGLNHPRFRCFLVPAGWPLIVTFQTLQARLCVLTMMDLHNFQLRRSIRGVHYAYVFHSLGSTHMVDHANSYDHYDTILCAAPHQMREIRRREELENLAPKRLVPHGYARLESLIALAEESPKPANPAEPLTVLMAPTWGAHSLLPSCGESLIRILIEARIRVILRPHYETVRQDPALVRRIREQFEPMSAYFEYVDAMGESDTLLRSQLLISDWSATAIEYALGLGRPVLFLDVPPRVRNLGYERWQLEPLEVGIRTLVGEILGLSELARAPQVIRRLVASPDVFAHNIEKLREDLVYNLGSSAHAGASALLEILESRAA